MNTKKKLQLFPEVKCSCGILITVYVEEGRWKAKCQYCRKTFEGILYESFNALGSVIILVEQPTFNKHLLRCECGTSTTAEHGIFEKKVPEQIYCAGCGKSHEL